MSSSSETASFDLFPTPSPALPHALSPTRWPGSTPESTAILRQLLQENHEKWHIFFNNIGFHKQVFVFMFAILITVAYFIGSHISHRLLALWALGADKEVLKAAYKSDSELEKERPAFSSPEPITSANFRDHLRDERQVEFDILQRILMEKSRYFSAYVQFFTDILMVQKKDVASVLEDYVFSGLDVKTRAENGRIIQSPLFVHFFEGLLHALIFVGYGLEFNLPGMIIEGLALAAVHRPTPGFEELVSPTHEAGSGDYNIKNLTLEFRTSLDAGFHETHAFTILAHVMKDPMLVVKEANADDIFAIISEKEGEKSKLLRQYSDRWSFNASDAKEVERKIEELQWMNTLIFTVAGFKKSKQDDFRADFYFMHLVTSSLFLPSLTAHLSPSSQELLLRGYFAISLALYVARGRPKIDPKPLFEVAMDDNVFDPEEEPSIAPPALSTLSSSSKGSKEPNLWLPLISRAILHPDDHVPKFQRAVAHYANLYGSTRKGFFDGLGIELNGVERIDGTLFARAGALTQRRLGRDREGKSLISFWDFEGFYGEDGERSNDDF
ncbi:hypothetical protein F5876DRAFT_36511 [Lentinula aff. lateritia]|uniref:Uncharacterized protein n=1 Tax=Lentinula aff. lateritia TaxID=2804960 RepID=A0ACC1U6X1_9AGAR|nr:hypothetical protein F5876DRAFT_36511 [Lentinula aff. lateritia]